MADKKFGDNISHEELRKMKQAHKAKHPGTTEHVLFSSDSIRALLNKSEFIQVHFCIDDAGHETVAFTAADSAGKTMSVMTDPPPVNRGQPCPPFCQ